MVVSDIYIFILFIPLCIYT